MKRTWEELPERLDRCFRYVSSYVGRRMDDRERLRHVVTTVLVGNLHLFVAPCDAREERRRLMASADRLLALEAGLDPDSDTASHTREWGACARGPFEEAVEAKTMRSSIRRWVVASLAVDALSRFVRSFGLQHGRVRRSPQTARSPD